MIWGMNGIYVNDGGVNGGVMNGRYMNDGGVNGIGMNGQYTNYRVVNGGGMTRGNRSSMNLNDYQHYVKLMWWGVVVT